MAQEAVEQLPSEIASFAETYLGLCFGLVSCVPPQAGERLKQRAEVMSKFSVDQMRGEAARLQQMMSPYSSRLLQRDPAVLHEPAFCLMDAGEPFSLVWPNADQPVPAVMWDWLINLYILSNLIVYGNDQSTREKFLGTVQTLMDSFAAATQQPQQPFENCEPTESTVTDLLAVLVENEAIKSLIHDATSQLSGVIDQLKGEEGEDANPQELMGKFVAMMSSPGELQRIMGVMGRFKEGLQAKLASGELSQEELMRTVTGIQAKLTSNPRVTGLLNGMAGGQTSGEASGGLDIASLAGPMMAMMGGGGPEGAAGGLDMASLAGPMMAMMGGGGAGGQAGAAGGLDLASLAGPMMAMMGENASAPTPTPRGGASEQPPKQEQKRRRKR